MPAAAEPAEPSTAMNASRPADVIDISRRTRTGQTGGHGRRHHMDKPAPRGDSTSGGDSTAQQFAELLEDAFNKYRRTLTDDDTLEAFDITLAVLDNVLAGALAQGIIDTGQHEHLTALIQGVKEAARLV